MIPVTRRRIAPVVALVALFALAGCGGGTPAAAQHHNPTQALVGAKRHLDQAGSVVFTLSTRSVPKKGNAVLGAHGTMTHAPAYRGNVRVVLSGLTATVPLVAVGGKVYARLPLTTKYSAINPADYDAPNPATFMSRTAGLSSLLVSMHAVKSAGQRRDGSQILADYSGVLPGADVQRIIPSAKPGGSYRTTMSIDSAGYLRVVTVTGAFFSGPPVTYTMSFDSYGKPVTITAP